MRKDSTSTTGTEREGGGGTVPIVPSQSSEQPVKVYPTYPVQTCERCGSIANVSTEFKQWACYNCGKIQSTKVEQVPTENANIKLPPVNYQQLSAILAGLRLIQEANQYDIKAMPHFLDVAPPTCDQIDALCERLNLDATNQMPGDQPAPAISRGMVSAALAASSTPAKRFAHEQHSVRGTLGELANLFGQLAMQYGQDCYVIDCDAMHVVGVQIEPHTLTDGSEVNDALLLFEPLEDE